MTDFIIKDKKEIITSKNLREKHKQNYRSINFIEGDFIDKILTEMSLKYNLPKKAIFREALIYYKMFMENNFKEGKNDKSQSFVSNETRKENVNRT